MCSIFDFGETTFYGNEIQFQVSELGKKYTKDFPVKKNPREFLLKWTQIKIKGNSFVKFSVVGPRSIYRRILY